MALVADPEALAAIVASIRAAPLVAFDLEFLSAERLVPVLCLVQVGWLDSLDAPVDEIVARDPRVELVDPLAIDVADLVRALAEHPRCVVHGGRQDLGILATRFGVTMPNLIDTQVMAAFAGIGDQIGFGSLVGELRGIAIDKGPQWTDWARRPLSDVQLAYADADARHLPALYALLAARLGDERVAWARAESAEIAKAAWEASQITPETAWQDVGGVRGLDDAALGVVAAAAAWRMRVARELDRPLGQVLNDRAIVEIARTGAREASALRAVKGVSPLTRTRADELAAAIAAAPVIASEPGSASAGGARPGRTPSLRAQRWAEILVALAHYVAEERGIAVRFVSTRAEAEEVARVADEAGAEAAAALPMFATWRRDLLAPTWLAWLRGEVGVVADTGATGIRLVTPA